jgi:hypothetical protein
MDETSEPIRHVVTDTDVEPISHVAGVSVVPREDSVVDGASMLSHKTSAAVGTAFDTLTQAVRKQNSQTLERFTD